MKMALKFGTPDVKYQADLRQITVALWPRGASKVEFSGWTVIF